MKKFGLVGYPLGHSFSAKFFAQNFKKQIEAGEVDFLNFALENVGLIRGVLDSHPELEGFCVTIPYKQQIFAYLEDVDDQAREIGAVNCVRVKDGKLYGHNTDAYGFENSLLKLLDGVDCSSLEALVLGTGGASKAVNYILSKNGIKYKTVSRDASKADFCYEALTEQIVEKHKLIVNTTPLGTFPNNDTFPAIPYGGISSEHYMFDLVYNPELTCFLDFGQKAGAKIQNGAHMLEDQAIKAWSVWGVEPD